MVNVTVKDIVNYIENQTQPTSYIIAGRITSELIPVTTMGVDESYSILESLLANVDWTQGFYKPMVLFSDEPFTSSELFHLHSYLLKKSTNIENIFLVTTHHLGIKQWWNDWKTLYRQKSFNIIEWMHCNCYEWQWYYNNIVLIDKDKILDIKKKIDYVFSYYGGDSHYDRCYMVLKMLGANKNKLGSVDFYGKTFLPLNEIIGNVEYMTYFQNQQEIDKIIELYNENVFNGNLLLEINDVVKKNQPIDYEGLQWSIDRRSFATVVRETRNTGVYPCVTEKTLRGFLYFCVVIPTNYQAVKFLEKRGFWFPHDIINYNYQNHASLVGRMNGITEVIDNLSTQFTNADLENYFQKNIDNFYQNAKLVLDIKQSGGTSTI